MSHRLNHKHSSDIQIVPKISAKKCANTVHTHRQLWLWEGFKIIQEIDAIDVDN